MREDFFFLSVLSQSWHGGDVALGIRLCYKCLGIRVAYLLHIDLLFQF